VEQEDATLGRIGGFRLIKRLATGGTSDVLLARAEGPHGFERTVVLKRLLSEHQNDPDFARMFTREAAAYARLSHPAIVRLFDFFTANAQLVMVLEYVDGVSLARLMTHAAQTNQKLDDRVSFFVASRIFDALSAAHDAHNPDTGEPTPVIHRDVNPSNVLIPWDGHAKLADFGIAKIQGSGEAETSQGLIKGTYGYMAPEQVRGERVTIRTDVYAATLVLWELLARRKAIQADKLPEMEILRAMAEPNLPKLDVLRPEVHESIREAVSRGLEPNPAKRSITAEEMMGILRTHFDPEDARQRLTGVLMQLSPRRSMSDTIAEDLNATVEAPSAPLPQSPPKSPEPPPAMTLPIATERPRTAPPRPPPPRPSQAATAVAPLPIPPAAQRPTTPSGFRPVAQAPAHNVTLPLATSAPRPQMISKPTLAGGFAPLAPPPQLAQQIPTPRPSEAPTLQTKPVDPSQVSFASSGSIPIHQASMPPDPSAARPPNPAPGAWTPTVPPAFRPPPVVSIEPRRSYVVPIVLAVVAALVVLGVAGAAIEYMRATSASSAPVATRTGTVSATTTTATATATPTTTATASVFASASVTPSASAAPSATSAPTAIASNASRVPTPGPNEGVLILPASANGHRIFVDGKVKGEGSAPLTISCGEHTVQIGSAGKPRDLNVPCGALAKIE